jgi:hypothetical protein
VLEPQNAYAWGIVLPCLWGPQWTEWSVLHDSGLLILRRSSDVILWPCFHFLIPFSSFLLISGMLELEEKR